MPSLPAHFGQWQSGSHRCPEVCLLGTTSQSLPRGPHCLMSSGPGTDQCNACTFWAVLSQEVLGTALHPRL